MAIDEVEVRDIICGISTSEEIQLFYEWITKKHLLKQSKFDTGVVSMDVEDVKASSYDVMRMARKLVISKESQPFQRSLDNRLVSDILEDGWKQTPGKIMFGDSLSWCAIISLPYQRNKNGDYAVKRIIPQPKLLESDELNEFLDLSGMAAVARFKPRARNMIILGVQVLGTILNKNVSTGDDFWGLPWAELPPSLQVYGIRDIRFGYICYSVLAGIMMRDVFP